MREHEASPDDVVPWEVVKADARKAVEQHRRQRATPAKKRSAGSTAKRKGKR